MGNAAEIKAPKRQERDCVEQMEALSGEFRAAVEAISANDISALEQSVRRQAEGSVRLRAALHERPAARASAESAAAAPAEKERIVSAARNLSRALKEYAAVMDYSGRAMRMLGALYGQRTAVDGEAHVNAAAGERLQRSWEV